jgi:hypothetical protein
MPQLLFPHKDNSASCQALPKFFKTRNMTPNEKNSLAADGTGVSHEGIQCDYNFR